MINGLILDHELGFIVGGLGS